MYDRCMIEITLKEVLMDNILTTALGLGAGGSIFYLLKNSLQDIFNRLLSLTYKEITINSNQSRHLFEKFESWLMGQTKIFSNSYSFKRFDEEGGGIDLTTGYGTSIYKIDGKYLFVTKTRLDSVDSWNVVELVTMRVYFTFNDIFIKNILNSLLNFREAMLIDKIKIINSHGHFYRSKRSISTISMNLLVKENLLKDIEKFLNMREEYMNKGVIYKRNYLLYGKPRCGKTSLIWSLASEFNLDICTVDLSTIGDISSLYKNIRRNSIIVFEDIDAMEAKVGSRELEGESSDDLRGRISLSSLLNIFDGLDTPEGMLCFFTTNHIDRLDPALIRDGRIDVKIKLDNISKTEILEGLANNLLVKEQVSILKRRLNEHICICPAAAQEILMKNDLEDIIYKLNTFVPQRSSIERI